MNIALSEQQLRALLAGKRIPGSVRAERVENKVVIVFHEYRRNGGNHRPAQTLLALPHGSVRKTPRRYKLCVSLPDNLGERRCGELMERESVEAHSFMNALESVLNNV